MSEIIDSEFEGEVNSQSAIAFNIPDLKAMAAKILRRANEVAQQKIAAAQKTVADMEKKARADGQAKGYAEGLKKAETEGRAAGDKAAREEFGKATGPIAGALQAALRELALKKQTLQADAEADLLRLAVEIARRVIRREIAFDPEFVLPQVREAIALTNNRSDLIIWLNPEDRGVVDTEMPVLRAIFSDMGRVELREDAAIERGGARVTGRDGEVDLRLATQLAALELAMVGDLNGLRLPPVTPDHPANAEVGGDAEPVVAQAQPQPPEEIVVAVPEPPAQQTAGAGDAAAEPAGAAAARERTPAQEQEQAKPAQSAVAPVVPAAPAAPQTSAAPEAVAPVDAPQDGPVAAGAASPAPARPAAPQQADAPQSAPAAQASAPGIVDAAAAGGFVEGVVDEHAPTATSSLAGLASLNDIPLDPAMEQLMNEALKGK